MSERDNILARIREGLKAQSPTAGAHPVHPPVSGPGRNGSLKAWLPAVGTSFQERIDLFQKNALALKTEFAVVKGPGELKAALLEMRDSLGWKKIATHDSELTTPMCTTLALPVLRTDQPYDAAELEQCDVGISGCDALIAQTGSVLVTNQSAGGRALSALPPHHVVIARADQLIADLPDAFELLRKDYQNDWPSFISFITGPSRTGDIERILVLGAHGPKRLTIFLLAG